MAGQVLHLYPFGVVVEKENSGAGDLLGFNHGLEIGEQAHVFRHVCGEDHVDDHLTQSEPLLFREVLEDVARLVLEQLERNGQRVVLEH